MTVQKPDLNRRAAVQTLLGGLASLPLLTLTSMSFNTCNSPNHLLTDCIETTGSSGIAVLPW